MTTEDTESTEAATPETDAAERMAFAQEYMVPTDFARNLERERDEAFADRDIARLAALDSDKAHDRMVGELEKVYKERDEAREYVDRYRERLDLTPMSWEAAR